jgi:hypothetical protein
LIFFHKKSRGFVRGGKDRKLPPFAEQPTGCFLDELPAGKLLVFSWLEAGMENF